MVIFLRKFWDFYTSKSRTLTPELDFLDLFSNFFFKKKTNSWDQCYGLNCVEMDPKIFLKNITMRLRQN